MKYIDIQCPFYCERQREPDRIKCEGFEKGMLVHLVFQSSVKRDRYLQRFCCEHYAECRIAQAQFKRYSGK